MDIDLNDFFDLPDFDDSDPFAELMKLRKKETISKTTPIKSKRRTKTDIENLKTNMRQLIKSQFPMTCRQVFYAMVSRGWIEKKESEYKNVVCRLLAIMRRDGTLPYYMIADSTRWMRKPTTYNNLGDFLKITAETYRRSVWADIPHYVEVWLEKEALAGVLYEETEKWDVPLMVTRGYPSISFLYEAAMSIKNTGKPTTIYYFGDRDPSGVDIPRVVEKELRKFLPIEQTFNFSIEAVTERQIIEMNLQTRPTKKSDARSKNFTGGSIEVDAIPPNDLRELVQKCITRHIDAGALQGLLDTERMERETIEKIAWTYE